MRTDRGGIDCSKIIMEYWLDIGPNGIRSVEPGTVLGNMAKSDEYRYRIGLKGQELSYCDLFPPL